MDKKYIKTLEAFMEAWKNKNWKEATKAVQLTWKDSKVPDNFIKRILGSKRKGGLGTPTETLKSILLPFALAKYEIRGHKTISNVTKDITVYIEYIDGSKITRHKSLVARLICEEAPMTPSPKGIWGVNPISLFTSRR